MMRFIKYTFNGIGNSWSKNILTLYFPELIQRKFYRTDIS